MKKVIKMIYRIVLIVLLIGLITGIVDYFQIKNNNFPLFALRKYEVVGKKETFRGLFYKATRTVTISQDESIPLSKDFKFTFLIFNLPVRRNPLNVEKDFSVETTEEKACSESKLYYYNGDTKIYTYCLDNINILDKGQTTSLKDYLDKDISIITKLENFLFVSSNNTKMTQYVDLEETNFTNKGLSLIKCHTTDNNDYYLGPRALELQADFCTTKDDIPKEEAKTPDEVAPEEEEPTE